MTTATPARRLTLLRRDIAAQSARCGSAPPTLIAVSKTFSAQHIEPFIAQGQLDFGENRVQEAVQKWSQLKALATSQGTQLRLHLIGTLQTNKVADAIGLFDVIHTLDRPKLAQKIDRHCREIGKIVPCFVQVNLGREPQKGGIEPDQLDEFIGWCRHDLELPLCGLMILPPQGENPTPYFKELRRLAHELGLNALSMGMSADWREAIAHGATHIRLGTSVFGERSSPPPSNPLLPHS